MAEKRYIRIMSIPAIKPNVPPALQSVARELARTVATETARRLGWQGVVSGGEWIVALEGAGTTAVEGIGATLWGIARIGLPILTLGLVMEGDAPHKPLCLSAFPKPQPDPKFVTQLKLDFLKQQKQLAELSGNKSLAQLFNLLILQHSADFTSTQLPGQNIVTGALNMVANNGSATGAVAASSTDKAGATAEDEEHRRRLTELLQVMPEDSGRSREAARTVLAMVGTTPQLFTSDDLAKMIEASASASPTWFGNKAVAELAKKRRDLFTDDIISRINALNNSPDSQDCFQLTVAALTQASTPQPAAPSSQTHPSHPPPVPTVIVPAAHAFAQQRIGGQYRPPAPQLKMPPKHTP